MSKLPRDLSAEKLIKKLEKLGYQATRQKGSHIILKSSAMKKRPYYCNSKP